MERADPAGTLITAVLQHYFPGWEPPSNRKEWNACLCPAHDENRASAAVSFDHDAVKCMACGFKGNAVGIIMRKEDIGYGAAVKRAEELSGGSHKQIPRKPNRKPGRRVFGQAGPDGRERGKRDRPVPPWLRG